MNFPRERLFKDKRFAEAIRKAVNVPVIGVGGVKTPEFANNIIREGKVDLVAVGRAMVANPGGG